jgi:hypothetical protein
MVYRRQIGIIGIRVAVYAELVVPVDLVRSEGVAAYS